MKDSDWYYHDDDDDFGEAVHRRTEELYKVPDAIIDPEGFIECPVLPLRDMVIYPHMVAPIFIGREATLLAIEEARPSGITDAVLPKADGPLERSADEVDGTCLVVFDGATAQAPGGDGVHIDEHVIEPGVPHALPGGAQHARASLHSDMLQANGSPVRIDHPRLGMVHVRHQIADVAGR